MNLVFRPLVFLVGIAVAAASGIPQEREALNQWLIAMRPQALGSLPLLPLDYDVDGKAVFQYVDPARHSFHYGGFLCVGFRFKTPPSVEGGFAWAFLLRSVTGPTNMGASTSIIFTASGPDATFLWQNRQFKKVGSYPALKEKFPFTKDLKISESTGPELRPNQEYIAIDLLLEHESVPEFAVALAFSEETSGAISRLPIGVRKPSTPEPTRTSIEGDPF